MAKEGKNRVQKRQRIRRALIIISFLLFPVTLYYFSPVLVIMGAAEGIVAGSFIVFLLLFISSLFAGRLFCGWICPAAGIQEVCFTIQDRPVKTGRRDWIKYFIWFPWIFVIIMMAIKAGGFRAIDFLYQTRSGYGISVAEPSAYIIFYFFISLMMILALISGKRAFCHYVCWMAPFMILGRKLCNGFKWPSLHLRVNNNKCMRCLTCTEHCPMSLNVDLMVQMRKMEHSECILCGNCVDSCPHHMIRYAVSKGRSE